MVIYPIPVEVTQARIQLVVDQAAKAPPRFLGRDGKPMQFKQTSFSHF